MAKKSGIIPKDPPRFTAADLTPDEAATHIQNAFRTSRARTRLKDLIGHTWNKGYDKKRGSFFYFNSKTGESSWEKPKVLGETDLGLTPRSEMEAIKARALVPKPKTPRFRATDLSKDEAAGHIQGAWRSHRARGLLRDLVAGVYSKGFDSESGRFFYYNSKTGESVWTKPAALGDQDLDVTPRSKIAAKKSGLLPDEIESAKPKTPKTPRFNAADLTPDAAAAHIQQAWRCRTARKLMYDLVSGVYEKKFDEASGAVYYTNTKTGESAWTKPKVLGDAQDLELSPRSNAALEKARQDAESGLKKKLDASTDPSKQLKNALTPEEAAVRIQGWVRAVRARRHLQAVMQHVYTKGFDPNTNEFYYYNKKTGASLWSKPKFLGNETARLTPRSAAMAKEAGRAPPPRRRAADLSEGEAAFMIQGAFRCRMAFQELQQRAENVWQKGYDHELDVFFYWNRKTKTSQWNKPYSLGSADLELTPRSLIGARTAKRVAVRKKRWEAETMAPEYAATVVQSWWRGYKSRKSIAPLVRTCIHKCYDASSKNFFWYNSRSGASSWFEPTILRRVPGLGDLPLTPRSMMLELHERRSAQREAKKKHRKTASEFTPDEAAFKIQGMYHGWISRNRVRAIIRSLYEKLYDAQRGTYYYFNRRTGKSSWYKPALLGSSDIRRAFVHSGSLSVENAAAAALAAAQTAGYTIGEAQLRGL